MLCKEAGRKTLVFHPTGLHSEPLFHFLTRDFSREGSYRRYKGYFLFMISYPNLSYSAVRLQRQIGQWSTLVLDWRVWKKQWRLSYISRRILGNSDILGLGNFRQVSIMIQDHFKMIYKNGHILPTGQWYNPSVVYSVILCNTLLYSVILCNTL